MEPNTLMTMLDNNFLWPHETPQDRTAEEIRQFIDDLEHDAQLMENDFPEDTTKYLEAANDLKQYLTTRPPEKPDPQMNLFNQIA